MEDALEQLQTKDTKERMAGVERLQNILEHSRKGLSANEVGSLVDASLVLLKDNNFRVSQGTLQALASAAALAGEHLKLHFNSLLPAIVERLGDGKQPVRDAGRQLLLALMEISSPTVVVERARSFAWGHRKWRVREEFARTVASAVNLFAATELPFLRMLLPSVLQLLEDSNSSVREAAMLCLEEMYRQGGSQFRDELQSHQLRPAQFKDITCRFDNIEPVRCSFESVATQTVPIKQVRDIGQCVISERKLSLVAVTARRSSLRVKYSQNETTIGGGREAGEYQVDARRVYSDKELVKEMEKAAFLLTPEQDWSVRIAAMQRIEGLVAGGATEYPSFHLLMKQLVGPLNCQLSDRRSSIVKQACQLLNLMSRELLVNFETFAESFIPVLFKLVVITVLVIAESADVCIKTMLRYCRVSRVLPKLTECAKHDRNAVLRARCCDYALLVLEQWGDSPEIQRSVDLYEELIKCCVGDAVSEVRCSARICYRVFSKCWPDRAQRIFVSFDASVQRLLNEEGVSQKRFAFPSAQEWGCEQQQPLKQSSIMPVTATRHQPASHATAAYSSATTVNSERSTCTSPALGIPVMRRSYEGSSELVSASSLERVLQASQQQVHAIENMLRGGVKVDKSASHAGGHEFMPGVSDKGALSISSKMAQRDPGNTATDSTQGHGIVNSGRATGVDNFTARQLDTSAKVRDLHSHIIDADQTGNVGCLPAGLTARRVPQDKPVTVSSNGYLRETKGPKRVMRIDYADMSSIEKKDMGFSCIPGFQRPLLRQRSSGVARSGMDENPVLVQFNARGELLKYTEVLMPLTDALTEGLSVTADWSARVAAFTFLRKVLQQGAKGLQEINHSFVTVMKLFSAHLDDPHHKVAHAALSTLAELVPLCRKSFEAYLERILPQVFGRVVDAKEVIRQLGSTVLEVVGNTYSIDSLLPALLRSLDEQRSPKVKMTIIDFAIVGSAKLAVSGETGGGTGLLKLWLAKLGPLAHDKNPKLKEAAVTGIISVYSHFDSTTVLNFILGLSIEEQSMLRRSLKQYTPRIEVDLMTYMQNKSQRGRSKFFHDHADSTSAAPEFWAEPTRSGYSTLTGSQSLPGHSSRSINCDGTRKWESTQHNSISNGNRLLRQTAASEHLLGTFQSCETSGSTEEISGHLNSKSFQSGITKEIGVKDIDPRSNISGVKAKETEIHLCTINSGVDCRKCPLGDCMEQMSSEEGVNAEAAPDTTQISELQLDTPVKYDDKFVRKVNNKVLSEDSDSSVPNLLQQIGLGSVKPTKKKYETLLQLIMSSVNESAAWSEHFNPILMVILESLDDTDGAVKELAMSTTFDMLNNQKPRLEESTEVLLDKLIQSTIDVDPKVSIAADRCRTIVLTEFDPHRCLGVVVRLLVSADEKTLITCISSLTMLVSRFAPGKLIDQLPSFLPVLFNAFGSPNADVRKAVVLCLVDIYIVLGEAFVPYLGSLSSTQLRLVTIYATRISQARMGTSLESGSL